MKNLFKTLMIIALVAMIGLSATSCVLGTALGGTSDMHGLFSGGGAKTAVTESATEIASYLNILYLFDTGYADYAKKVKEAQEAGKKVSTTVTWILIGLKTTAYAR